MTAPVSLVVSGFAPVTDVRLSVTPQLLPNEDAQLLLLDLGRGANRLAGSALAQVYSQLGDTVPDLDQASDLLGFFKLVQKILYNRLIYTLVVMFDLFDNTVIVTLNIFTQETHAKYAANGDMGRTHR